MSTVRFVHVGDVHFHAGPRQADRVRVLNKIIDAEAKDPPDAWLFPGDLFDARSSIADRNILKEVFKRMADAAPVWACHGNHDAAGDLDIFGDLNTRFQIIIADTPRVLHPVMASRERATVFFLPWPTEAGLVSDGVALDRIGQEAREILERIFIDAGSKLAEARSRGEVTLMIGHVNHTGAQLRSVGQPPIGAQISVDHALLGRLGPCYQALNHVHIAQKVGEWAYYAGSVCRLTWGEVEPKIYNVVTYKKGNGIWTPMFIEHRPVNVAPMWHVELWLTRDGIRDVRATAGPDGEVLELPASSHGKEVRVRARYHQSEGAVLATGQLAVKRWFADALRFEFEPVCVPDRGLRAPEVSVARTLPEKLEAWSKVSGVVLLDDAAAKARQLETEDADVLVATVESRMQALCGTTETVNVC